MSNICTILVVLTALSGILAAQACLSPTTFKHTLPAGFETVDGNYGANIYNHYCFSTSNNTRHQYCYSWTQFVHQMPVAICEIAFRNRDDVSFTGGTYQGVEIKLASSPLPHTNQNYVFAANLGADVTTVLTGGTVIVPNYTAPATPGATAPFNLIIPFTQPFLYNPALQQDLVIDITVSGTTPVGNTFQEDGDLYSAYGSGNGHTSDPTATSADWHYPDFCPIVEITYSLGHSGLSSQFDLIGFTSGGGAGDLSLTFVNIPAGTVAGYTFMSTLAYSLVVPGAEFGRGFWFGIFPDPLTIYSITSPLALGNPFHWTYPAAPFFPDAPIVLPTGTLASLAGQTWELVGVAMGPGATILGHTAPIQLAW